MRFVLRLFSLAAAAVLLSAHPAFASRILFGVDNTGDGDQLYKMDVGATTPALELVGDITTTSGERLFGIAGLAWDSKRGFLVGIGESGLYSFTIAGSQVTANFLSPLTGSGLEYVESEDLYYFSSPRTLSYVLASSPYLPLDSQPFRGNNEDTCGEQFETCSAEMTGLAYGASGLVGFGIAPVEESLYLIHPGTTLNGSTVSLVDLAVSSGFTDNAGMAFDTTASIYYTFVAGKGLYETNVKNTSIGSASFVNVFTATNNIQSLAFAGPTAVPEPGTLSMVLIGVGVLARRFSGRGKGTPAS